MATREIRLESIREHREMRERSEMRLIRWSNFSCFVSISETYSMYASMYFTSRKQCTFLVYSSEICNTFLSLECRCSEISSLVVSPSLRCTWLLFLLCTALSAGVCWFGCPRLVISCRSKMLRACFAASTVAESQLPTMFVLDDHGTFPTLLSACLRRCPPLAI